MQLERLCEKDNVRIDARMTDKRPLWDDGKWQGYAYKVTLRRKGRVLTVDFFCGELAGEPTAADVLSCLTMDARTFQGGIEALEDMGYDNLSEALKVWRAIEKQAPKTLHFLGFAFDAYANAEH